MSILSAQWFGGVTRSNGAAVRNVVSLSDSSGSDSETEVAERSGQHHHHNRQDTEDIVVSDASVTDELTSRQRAAKCVRSENAVAVVPGLSARAAVVEMEVDTDTDAAEHGQKPQQRTPRVENSPTAFVKQQFPAENASSREKETALVAVGFHAPMKQSATPLLLPRAQHPRAPLTVQRPVESMNILVLGGRQVGKSAFINAYRAAITQNDRWPAAPVGICGKHGTTAVMGYPNRVFSPSCVLIDTPGHVFDELGDDASDERILLHKYFTGLPFGTRIVGRNAPSIAEISEVPAVAANCPHHCVLLVRAVDLLHDFGWQRALRLKPRYEEAETAAAVISAMQELIELVSTETAMIPFVVVTHADALGRGCAEDEGIRSLLLKQLSRCMAKNRCFVVSLSAAQGSSAPSIAQEQREDSSQREATLQGLSRAAVEELQRLHTAILCDVAWRHSNRALFAAV